MITMFLLTAANVSTCLYTCTCTGMQVCGHIPCGKDWPQSTDNLSYAEWDNFIVHSLPEGPYSSRESFD